VVSCRSYIVVAAAITKTERAYEECGGIARFHALFKPLLFEVIRSPIPDPRRLRGRRHPLLVILVLTACATLVAGNDSVVAIWQWAATLRTAAAP